MKIWVLFLGQICFTSHLPHYNNSSQIGFNQKKGELKKMKSIGQNLEESNTYSIFVYELSLKYYKIFRKIFILVENLLVPSAMHLQDYYRLQIKMETQY